MLRNKHENVSVILTILGVLCLWSYFMLSLSIAPANAQSKRQSASTPSYQPYYAVDAYEKPGVVYKIQNRRPVIFYKRRSGDISSIAIWQGQLYFCSTNDKKIYQRMGQRERVVFEHEKYVRDIAVDANGNVYFSEANDNKGDGRIYKLTPCANELGSKDQFNLLEKERPISVYLKNVNGFWVGDFTFDPQGNLYLCTGGRTPAFIYKVAKEDGCKYGSPKNIYRNTRGYIKGIAIEPNVKDPDNPIFIYYTDLGLSIFRMRIENSKRSVAFSGRLSFSEKSLKSRSQHLSDIAFDVGIRIKK